MAPIGRGRGPFVEDGVLCQASRQAALEVGDVDFRVAVAVGLVGDEVSLPRPAAVCVGGAAGIDWFGAAGRDIEKVEPVIQSDEKTLALVVPIRQLVVAGQENRALARGHIVNHEASRLLGHGDVGDTISAG